MRRRNAFGSIRCALPWVLAATSVALLTAGSHAARRADPSFDASVRHLRRAISPNRDGSHLPLLLALRQLHEPSLRPFFHRVVQDEHWQMQVHAILGLAETENPNTLDPWLVARAGAEAQEAVIATALDTKLLAPADMRELLEVEELTPMPRLMLCAELLVLDEPVDPDMMERLATSPRHRVAAFASLLCAKSGDPGAFSAYRERLAKLPRRDRNRRLLWLLEATRQYEVVPLLPWVESLLDEADLHREVAYWGLYTLLVLDTPNGLERWMDAVGPDPDDRDRVRYGMLLLAAAESVPAGAFDRLEGDSDLTRRMAAAGRAVASGNGVTTALEALLDVRHPRTTAWVLSAVKKLPATTSAEVLEYIVDHVDPDDSGGAERIALAIGATSDLFELDPARVLRRLETVEDDSLLQEVLLLGLFDSRSPAAGAAASGLRRIGAGRADTLALLLIARHAGSLPASDLERLGRIAAGGGRVSEGLQVQAAWLYIKHRGAIELAMSRIFEEVD